MRKSHCTGPSEPSRSWSGIATANCPRSTWSWFPRPIGTFGGTGAHVWLRADVDPAAILAARPAPGGGAKPRRTRDDESADLEAVPAGFEGAPLSPDARRALLDAPAADPDFKTSAAPVAPSEGDEGWWGDDAEG